MAVNNNSSAILAQQRLQKAQELIDQVNAQARPQITANVVDTYSSTSTFGTQGANVTNPTLPGGGVIPTITDAGGGNLSTLVTGGGGGTAASNGRVHHDRRHLHPVRGDRQRRHGEQQRRDRHRRHRDGKRDHVHRDGNHRDRNAGTGNTGTGTTGTGTGGFGTTGPGTSSTGGGAGAQAVALEEIPPIARQYAAVTQAPAARHPPARHSRGRCRTPAPAAAGTGTGTGHHDDRHHRSRRDRHRRQLRPAQQLQRAGERHAVH